MMGNKKPKNRVRLTVDNLDKILEKIGVTKEDMKEIFNAKLEDLSPEYKEIFDRLDKQHQANLRAALQSDLQQRMRFRRYYNAWLNYIYYVS